MRIRRPFVAGLAFGGLAFVCGSAFADPPIASRLAAESASRITVHFDLGEARVGRRVEMPLPGGAIANLTVERLAPGAGATVLQAHADDERVSTTALSVSGATAFGVIRAHGRDYQVETGADGIARITDSTASGAREKMSRDDAREAQPAQPAPPAEKADVEAAFPAGNTIVDMGIFYTPSMATRYGLTLGARLNFVVDRLNMGLANSNVPISYNLGYVGAINYSETAQLGTMLTDLQASASNANGDLSATESIRTAKGLDIISAQRVFINASHEACGVGYRNGQAGSGVLDNRSSPFGYNVVSDGRDINGELFLCTDNTLAHETGHNMGLAHNREDASGSGVFSYSYGWRVAGSFRTIMAYASSTPEPQALYFSDPGITTSSCSGQPCGRPIGAADEADNAQSLRNVGANVANFRARTPDIFAATLPGSRFVQTGSTATAFASIINDSAGIAHACGVTVHGAPAGAVTFRATDPATNAPTGVLNAPVDIPPHGTQTFVFSLAATSTFAASELPIAFYCADRRSAAPVVGLNTLFYGATSNAQPDMIALVDTMSHDGVAAIPGVGQSTAFVAAASNVGSSGSVVVTADTGSAVLPLIIGVCQTNTSTGACLAQPSSSITTPQIPGGGTASFSIFLTAQGPIPFDPAGARVFVRFRQGSTILGSTSVAVRTP